MAFVKGSTPNCQTSWHTWRGLSGSNARRMTPRPGEAVAHRLTASERVQLRAPDHASAPIARSPPPQAGLGAAQCGPSDRALAGLHWRRRTCTAVEGGALRQRAGPVGRRWARGCGKIAGGGMARKQQGGRLCPTTACRIWRPPRHSTNHHICSLCSAALPLADNPRRHLADLAALSAAQQGTHGSGPSAPAAAGARHSVDSWAAQQPWHPPRYSTHTCIGQKFDDHWQM